MGRKYNKGLTLFMAAKKISFNDVLKLNFVNSNN